MSSIPDPETQIGLYHETLEYQEDLLLYNRMRNEEDENLIKAIKHRKSYGRLIDQRKKKDEKEDKEEE
jgi:hypothetical protein